MDGIQGFLRGASGSLGEDQRGFEAQECLGVALADGPGLLRGEGCGVVGGAAFAAFGPLFLPGLALGEPLQVLGAGA